MPFQRGNTLSRGRGRPRGSVGASTQIKIYLDELGTKGKTDLHAQRLDELTRSRDEQVAVRALALALSYRYGKPVEHHELSGPDGGPIEVHDHFAVPAR